MIYLLGLIITFIAMVKYPKQFLDEDYVDTELLIILSIAWPATILLALAFKFTKFTKLVKIVTNKLVIFVEKLRCRI